MTGPSAGGLPGPALRRGVLLASAAGAAALAALAVVARNGEPPLRALALMDRRYLALAVGLTAAAWWLRVVRSGILVRALGIQVPAGRLFTYYLASVFVSHVTPTSTGGVPVFIYLLTREGLSAGQATAVAVIDSGLVALWLLVAWPAAGVLVGFGATHSAGSLSLAVAVALALVAAFVGYTVVRPRSLARWLLGLRRLSGRSGQRRRFGHVLGRLSREALRFSLALRFFVLQRPWPLGVAIVTTGLYWAAYLSIAWAVVRGLGGWGDWVDVAVRQLAFNLAQAFIPTPGGSGGAELMMAYLLRGLLPASRLAVAVGVWRLCTFYASLAVGGVLFMRVLRSALAPRPKGKAGLWANPGLG